MEEREDPQAEYARHESEKEKEQDERNKRLGIGKYTDQEASAAEEPNVEEQKDEEKKSSAKSSKSG